MELHSPMSTESRAKAAQRFDRAYFERESLEHGRGYRFEDVYAQLRPFARVWSELGVRRALDVGCAKGGLVSALVDEGIDAYGVDVSEYALEASPVRGRLRWVDVQSEDIPFPQGFFDLVITLETVEHLEHPERLLADAYRVVRFGGLLYVTTPSWKSPHDTDPTHINIKPRRDWWRLIRQVGFSAASGAVRRDFRAAVFRMHYQNPYRGRLLAALPVDPLGSLICLLLACYRTQKAIRLGHPGTQIFATK